MQYMSEPKCCLESMGVKVLFFSFFFFLFYLTHSLNLDCGGALVECVPL